MKYIGLLKGQLPSSDALDMFKEAETAFDWKAPSSWLEWGHVLLGGLEKWVEFHWKGG